MLRKLCRAGLIGTLVWSPILVPSAVVAQTGGASGGLTSADFSYYLQTYDFDQQSWIQMSAARQTYFFNRARCECNGDTTRYSGYFRVAIQPGPTTGDKIRALLTQNLGGVGSARLYAGGDVINCLNPASFVAGAHASYCMNLLDPGDINASFEGGMAAVAASRVWYSAPIPAAWLFNVARTPVCSGSACDYVGNCTMRFASVNIYFWAQTGSGQYPDLLNSFFTVNLAGQTTFAPSVVTAEAGNEAVTVGWAWPDGLSPAGNPAFAGVQVFCARDQNQPAFKPGTFAPAFMTSAMSCPAVAPRIDPPSAFGNLDASFLCSDLLPSTATSHRITGLQNGGTYSVGVAAVDRFGNIGAIVPMDVVSVTPTASAGGPGEQGGPTSESDGGASSGVRLHNGCSCATASSSDRGWALAGLLGLGILCNPRRRPTRCPDRSS